MLFVSAQRPTSSSALSRYALKPLLTSATDCILMVAVRFWVVPRSFRNDAKRASCSPSLENMRWPHQRCFLLLSGRNGRDHLAARMQRSVLGVHQAAFENVQGRVDAFAIAHGLWPTCISRCNNPPTAIARANINATDGRRVRRESLTSERRFSGCREAGRGQRK